MYRNLTSCGFFSIHKKITFKIAYMNYIILTLKPSYITNITKAFLLYVIFDVYLKVIHILWIMWISLWITYFTILFFDSYSQNFCFFFFYNYCILFFLIMYIKLRLFITFLLLFLYVFYFFISKLFQIYYLQSIFTFNEIAYTTK